MKYYDLYGLMFSNLDTARDFLEATLGIQFIPHDSFYHGEYYLFQGEEQEELMLKSNFDEVEQEFAEEEFSRYPVLLYASEVKDPQALQQRLVDASSKVELLRREVL